MSLSVMLVSGPKSAMAKALFGLFKYEVSSARLVSLVTLVGITFLGFPACKETPNVVLVITDDQGYGDLGYHGNQQLRTPNLDRLAGESLVHTQFHVSPVCAPTRASLMTGRYNYRTGVVDTYLGRAMMYPDEVTLAEMLTEAGYQTGIFGKWHLGDNYPLRAKDQGFQESLVHRGGGIGQPSDPPGNTYFDPVLLHNGQDVSAEGYCTDIFFQAAEKFIERARGGPFFAYIATNAPHTPLQISDHYVEPYRKLGLEETTARVYGMISNIDENVGRLMSKLDAWNLRENTIFIFMTDNGHQQPRYSSGLRGRKASVFDGGIKVPFFVRWPSQVSPGKLDLIAAHIDVVPTLLEACGVSPPDNVLLDGISLMPFWIGKNRSRPDRQLFFQSHRGDIPEPGRACAVRAQRYKLVQPEGWEEPARPRWMLFDIEKDPGEERDLSLEQPEVMERMRSAYHAWLADVSSTRGYAPPAIGLGTEFENPVTLTRQDWRGPKASWSKSGIGHWVVEVKEEGMYSVRFRFPPTSSEGFAELRLAATQELQALAKGSEAVEFDAVRFEKGRGILEATLNLGEQQLGVHYVDVEKIAGTRKP